MTAPGAAQLVADLEAAGVRLWEADGTLRFRAPQGVMTAERVAALRHHKMTVLELLRDARGLPQVRPEPERRHEPFPLTAVQAAYLVGRGESHAYGGVGCHGYGEMVYDELDPPRMRDALRATIARHDMLRAVVEPGGAQRVLEHVPPFALAVRDVRGTPPEDQARAVRQTRAEMDHRVYDPARWPLLDARVTRTDEAAVLHFSLDFLIGDLVSLELVLDELHRRYDDPAWAPPPPPVTFRDCCAARRRLERSDRRRRDRDHWMARIDELPAAPELPLSRPDGDRGRFVRHSERLDAERWATLRARGAEHGITPSAVVLAAYAEVIGRWSRGPAFTLDVTVLDRLPLHPAIDQVVGDFTGIELLAVDAAAGATFAARASAVQERLWRDMDHRLFGGVEVLREIARRRGPDGALFPVVFTSGIGLGGGGSGVRRGRMGEGISQTPQVWIDCQAMERGDGLDLNWDVRDGVLAEGVAQAMFAAFGELLDRLADEPQAWTDETSLPLPADQRRRRQRFNDTGVDRTRGSLHGPVLEQAAATPGRPAVIAPSGVLTYGALVARAAAVAGVVGDRERPPGAPVGIVMDRGPDQVVAALGALMAGAAYVPVDNAQPARRAEAMLAAAGVDLVLTQADSGAAVPDGLERVAVDALRPADAPGPWAERPEAPAYVMFTSGSTGQPKGVVMSHAAARNTVADVAGRWRLTEDDRVLGVSSLAFDLSVFDVFGPLSVGGALIVPEHARRGDASHWAELVARHHVTVWNSVPALLELLLGALDAEPGHDVGSLRLALLSGDWIPVTLPDQARRKVDGLTVVSLGGATEAGIWSIAHPIGEVDPSWTSIPYGRPLANQRVHVLDRLLRPAPDWVTGELHIGGAGLAEGYAGDAELTDERFITHPRTGERLYRTGDAGRHLPGGEIELLGRLDAQVKIRGHRVEPAEVEAVLAGHPAVGAAAVLAVGDEPTRRRLAAFAEPAPLTDAEAGARRGAAEDVLTAVSATAARALGEGDARALLAYARQLDATALMEMMRAFHRNGLFADGCAHTLDEVLDRAAVAPKHHRLVRRWLRGLETHGLVARDAGGRFVAREAVDETATAAAWAEVDRLRPQDEGRDDLVRYFRRAAEHLPVLLRGDQDPLSLLFPEGRVDIHEVAYRDNLLSRALNRIAAAVVSEVARRWDGPGPMTILEVGAGVGGTTTDVLSALDGLGAEYVFTDVSPFFLNNARERFSALDWVTYRAFDLNADPRAQGFAPNSMGLVLCANVLHYAHDADRALARLRELLMPGGWLVFLETTRDNYQVLTSMELLFDATAVEFQDVRAGRDETFIAQPEWLRMLRDAGADPAACHPAAGDPLAAIGMHAFAARFKAGRRRPVAGALRAHLTERLPEPMVPTEIQVVDALPLTSNGKVDRARLAAWASPGHAERPASSGAPPADGLESALAAIWAEHLGVQRIARDVGFLEVGGDSLVAAQVAGRTRERVDEAAALPYDDLLRLLLGGTSIAQLAEAVTSGATSSGPVAARRASALVSLSPVLDGPATVVFHDATGGLEAAEPFVRALAERLPLFGATVAQPSTALAADAGLLLDELAEHHAEAVLERLPEGAHLVGCRAGGLVAAETAARIMERGGVVCGLTVLAAHPTPWPASDALVAEHLLACELGLDPALLELPAEAVVARAVRDPAARPLKPASERPQAERWERGGRPEALADLELFAATLTAVAREEATPYAGSVTLLLPTEETPLWPGLPAATLAYWRARCLGEPHVVEVPGNAFTCLSGDRGEDVARRLLDVIGREARG